MDRLTFSENFLRPLLLVVAGLLMTACATRPLTTPEVVERSTTAKPDTATPAVPEAKAKDPTAYYTVKKGDTLFGIALQVGQDYRDIAAWNNLESPYLIRIDQVLRVKASDGATAVPVPTRAPGTTPLGNSQLLKSEPSGLRRPYSEAALAEMLRPDANTALSNAVAATPAAAPKTELPKVTNEVGDSAIGWMWPGPGKVIEEFSEAKNKGLDLAGKAGDPVYATADGKVVYSGNGLRGYGNLIIIKHNSNFLSAYAHNSTLLVKEQQNIKRGQQIAEMGNSDAEQVKLHFEIRNLGKPVDPMKYLPPR